MDNLRRTFRDIIAGKTRAVIAGRQAFIRHLGHSDQVEIDERREQFYEQARTAGIKTDAEVLADLNKDGRWSDAKEADLVRARTYITDLETGKRKNAKLPSMVRDYNRKIEEAKKDWETKELEKRQLMGLTCEVAANRELNDFYVVTNLYADASLTQPLFTATEFDYLKQDEVGQIGDDYQKAMEGCSDQAIKQLAMQPFFQQYFQIAGDNLSVCFGKPVFELTYPQVELIRWGAHFRHIFTTHDVSKWSPDVLNDPDALSDHASAVTKGKDELAAQGANEPGAIVVGAKAEDAKALGIKSVNPIEQIQKQFGGDMMKWAAKNAR